MHNFVWKLAALAGVVSVGFLMIFQAQRGLTRADGDNIQAPFEEFAGTAKEGGEADHSENKNGTDDVSFAQSEPTTVGDLNDDNFDSAPQIAENDAGQGLVGQSEPPQDTGLPEQFQSVPLTTVDDFTVTPDTSISDATASERPTPGGLDFRQQTNASGKNGSSRPRHPLAEDPIAEDKENPFANPSDHAGDEDQDAAKANGASSGNIPDDVKPDSEPELADNERPAETKNDTNPFDDAGEQLTAEPVEREPIQPAGYEETVRGNPKLNSGFEPAAPQKTTGTNGPRLMPPGASTASPIDADLPHFEQNSAKKNRSTDQPVEDDPFGSGENPATADQTSEGPFQSADAEKLAPFTPQKDPSNRGLERRNPFASQPKGTLQPDPAAFDNISAPGSTEPSNPFDRTMPKQKPAGDDDQTKVPQRPSMGSERPARGEGPKAQLKPFPATGRETGDKPNLPLDTKRTASSAETATQQQAAPGRLNPKPKASRLVPPKPEDFQGEATVDAEVPRGPQRPQLNIEKTAPKNALLGQPLIYSILIKNLGDSPAHQVIVEDSIPKGTKLNGTIPRAEMTGKKLVWKLGTLEPGEQRRIRVRVIPIKEGQVGSIATVNFVSKVAAQTMITAPALSLELTGPPQVKLGEPITFNFKVTNNGSGKATGVFIRNLIPEQLTHPSGSDLEYEVGTLTAGKSKQFVLSVTAAKIGSVINRATLTADGDFSVEAKTELEILGSPLLVTRSGPKKRPLGRPAVYSNRIVNNSAAAVQGITVVETVPDGMEFVKASHGGQYDGVKRTVAWAIDQLGPKETQEVQVEFVARRSGTMASLVTVTDGFGSQTNVSSQTTVAGLAALATDVHGVNGPVAVGETVSLQIRVRNRGSDKASNVTLRISVPNELQFLEATGAAKPEQAGRELRFAAVSTLDARNDTVVTIVLKAVRSGEARLKIQVDADHMNQPLIHEEAIAVITAN